MIECVHDFGLQATKRNNLGEDDCSFGILSTIGGEFVNGSMKLIILAVVVKAEDSIGVADVVRLDDVFCGDAGLTSTSRHCSCEVRVGGGIDIDD